MNTIYIYTQRQCKEGHNIYTHLQYWTFCVIKVRTSWNKTMQTYITNTTAKWQINGPKKQEKLGQHRLKLCGK